VFSSKTTHEHVLHDVTVGCLLPKRGKWAVLEVL
jgi:hypothetical protein